MHLYIQIVITKLYTLVLILIFPTPCPQYEQQLWYYKKADSTTIALVNWEKLFDQKDIIAQVPSLNENI